MSQNKKICNQLPSDFLQKNRTRLRDIEDLTVNEFFERVQNMPRVPKFFKTVIGMLPTEATPIRNREEPAPSQPLMLPINNDESKVLSTFEEMIKTLINRSNRKEILSAYFIDEKEDQEIAALVNRTTERVRQIHTRFLSELLKGQSQDEEIKIDANFIQTVNNLRTDCQYKFVSDFTTITNYQDNIEKACRLLDLGICTLEGDDNIIVPTNEIIRTRNTIRKILAILQQAIIPISIERVFNGLSDNTSSLEFIGYILNKHGQIECIENNYQIKIENLPLPYQVVGRIIYVANDWIHRDDVLKKYNEITQREVEFPTNILNRTGLFASQGRTGFWKYTTEAPPIINKIIDEEIIRRNYLVTFEQIKQAIETNGLQYDDNTIRAYITNKCVPSNNDRKLFCHKEHTSKYPDHRWRIPAKHGTTNWIVNQTIDIVKANGSVKKQELRKLLEEKNQKKEYNLRHIEDILSQYIGENELFTQHEGSLKINNEILSITNLKTIGYYRKHKSFYMDIYSLLINILKKTEGHCLPFADCINSCLKYPEFSEIDYNGIVKILDYPEVPQELTIITKDNQKYLKLLVERIEAEPVLKMQENQDIDRITESEGIVIELDTKQRKEVSFNLRFDWDEIVHTMKTELKFYQSWYIGGITLETSIERFKQFCQQTDRSNLSTLIPQTIYEFWFGDINNFDKIRYMNDLLRCYEALLIELHRFRTDGNTQKTVGLRDVISKFYPELDNAFNGYRINFAKFIYDLWYNRNKISHGAEIEATNVESTVMITNYIALYVYTVGKYFKP